MKKMLLSLLLILGLSASLSARSTVIEIRSQLEFNLIGQTLESALKNGYDQVTVRFAKGVYCFGEKHINIVYWKYPGASVVFDGNGAVLTGKGFDINAKRRKSGRYVATSVNHDWQNAVISLDKLTDLRPFGPLRQSSGPIEVVDAKNGLCRLPCTESDLLKPYGTAIQFTSWYRGLIYPVTKIQGGYVYFKVADLSKNGAYYNIEGDKRYGGKHPKYQLINSREAEVWWDGGKLRFQTRGRYHVSIASQAVEIMSSQFKSLEFKNFTFLGNGGSAQQLIHFFNLTCPVTVRDCTFRGIRNLVISSRHQSAASYTGNVVEGCYKGFIIADRESVNTSVRNNRFNDNQLFMDNHFDVVVRGKNYLVKDNVFTDFTYGAIGAGNHFTSPGNPDSSGIIEDNEIFYTESFRKDPTRTLMDSGAIYCWTKQDDLIIRNNYIHDIVGTKDNRGIFGDDGTINTTVTGNKILRIANSYDIDFRRVSSVETQSNSSVKKTNVGIKMYDNTIDGKVRFEPRSGDKTSRNGKNKTIK